MVTLNNLLEAGVHFGHQKRRWNPKMGKFIFNSREDIYIIDLQKTMEELKKCQEKVKEIVENNGKILLVGTKKQAKEAIEKVALDGEHYFVNERWLGGTLTNFRTIRSRVKRMEAIEEMEKDNTFDLLPKKEVIKLKKEYEKLNKNLKGIREMRRLPQLMIIVDPEEELIAIKEAKKLGIPTMGILSTNSDPDLLNFPLPGNDESVKSISVLLEGLNEPVLEAKGIIVEENNEVSEEEPKEVEEVKEKTVSADDENRTVVKEKIEIVDENNEENIDLTNLEEKTLPELKEIARLKKLTGFSTLKKKDLVELIKNN